MTALREFRETARTCVNANVRKLLQNATDELAAALDELHANPNVPQLQRVNGCWSRCSFIASKARPMPDPSPLSGGLNEGALLQVAA